MFGFAQLITALLTLSGFGVRANPHAPAPAAIMRYAPAHADGFVYLDIEAVLPANYAAFVKLPRQAALAAFPRAHALLERAAERAQAARKFVQASIGVDPVLDLKSVAAWISFRSSSSREFIIAVRGRFPADLLRRAAKLAGVPASNAGARAVVVVPGAGVAAGLAADGTLLIGSDRLVEPRIKSSWRPHRPDRSVTAVLARHPFLAVCSSPSRTALGLLPRALTRPGNPLVDLLRGHTFAAVALTHRGALWTYAARDARGYRRAVLASRGAVDLLRAAQLSARGLARIAAASLPSYQGRSRILDALIAHRRALVDLAVAMSGDGHFRAALHKQPHRRTVTVTLRGSKVSDVLPLAVLLPLVGGVVAWKALPAEPPPPVAEAARPAATPPPAEKRSPPFRVKAVYQRAKRSLLGAR